MKTNQHFKLIVMAIGFIICGLAATAQTTWDTLPFKDYADYKLQNLNKAYVSTGILYDRVFPIAQLDNHIASPNSTDTATPAHLAQAYYEMYNASYNTTGWLTPTQIDDQIKAKGKSRQHPIGIFLYNYNVVDSNALADNLLDTMADGRFYDVANRSRSPYFSYTSFMASPLKAEDQVLQEGEHTFYIDQQFFLHNTYLNVQQIRIDFGDGQGEWVVNNPFDNNQQTLSTGGGGFLNSIVKQIGRTLIGRIVVIGIDIAGHTVQYGNPFVIFAKSNKQYAPLTFCKGGGQKWVIDADATALATINTQYGNPQLEYKNADGNPVKDTAYFYFAGNGNSCNTGVLRKPIVFIDGFDPSNTRGVQQIYEDFINKQVTRNGNRQVLFGDYMLEENYDLIILDFKHGNDLLERNAMTLVALLQRLYQTYGSTFTQDITVIGPSMGSLIAQYALAYMEHNNIPHHVKTYISFDGCHQGANVPIGLQNYIEYITQKGILKGVKSIREGLYNGLAAKQMLAHHHTANSQFPAPDALRTMFLQNLAAVGEYPTQCRNVAVINGASNGTLNPYKGTNTDMLDISLKRKGWKSLWGLCGDNICKRFRWIARKTTNSGTNKVADMWTLSPVFNVLFWVPPGYTNYYAQAAWGNSAQDNAPGGLIGNKVSDDIQTHGVFLAKELVYLLTGDKPNIMLNVNNFTMMPSYSSADLRFGANNSNKNLYMNWSTEYLCGHTPFDYVYAPSSNEEHVSVTQDGSQWFENEIRCDVANLPVLYSPFIQGNSSFCTSDNYSVLTCKPSNFNITWTATPSGIVSIGGSGQQITLNKLGDGIVTLKATINNGTCGVNTVLQKTITVGSPKPTYIDYTIDSYVDCYEVRFTTNNTVGSTYTWSYFKEPYSSNLVEFPNSDYTKKLSLTQGSGYYSIGVTATNTCGTSPIYYITTPYIDCEGSGGGGHRVAPKKQTATIVADNDKASLSTSKKISTVKETAVYPNPANKTITVTIPQTTKTWATASITIIDEQGRAVKTITTSNTVTTIDITALAQGSYVVKIFDGKTTTVKKLLKY